MQTEVYRDEINVSSVADEAELHILNELGPRYRDCGLPAIAQAVEYEKQQKIRFINKKHAACFYREIPQKEWKIWKAYLPTKYSKLRDRNFVNLIRDEYHTSERVYAYDRVPMEVLSELEFCVKNDLFEQYDIRTPEKRPWNFDPILVGWFNETPYMIARWGESLEPFNNIKWRVYKRRIFISTFWSALAVSILLLVGYRLFG